MNVYQLTVRHPAFEEIKTLLIAISSLATAVSYHTDGHAQFNPGDYVTVECRHMSGRVRLPIHGPVQAAIAGRLPDTIEITVLQGRDAERGFSVYTDGFQEYFRSLVHPLVLSCYQRHRSTLHAKFGGSRIAWPPSWQFAWAVRNASAHAGRAFDSKPRKPVVWRSLEFSPEDEPQQCMLDLVNGGDLLVLMIEMGNELVAPNGLETAAGITSPPVQEKDQDERSR